MLQTLSALHRAQGLAGRLEATERERPSHRLSLRVQVVTDEALQEWLRFAGAVLTLLEADRLDDDDTAEPAAGSTTSAEEPATSTGPGT